MTPNQIKWVEALRSGKYKQGKGYLSRGGEYCCLGVACDIFNIPATDAHYPPKELVNLLDLVDDAGRRRGPDGTDDTLAHHNDNGKDFEAIADLIETGNYFATVPLLPEGSKGLD